MAAKIPLTAFKRVPFVEDDGATFVFFDMDWSTATFAMQIRQKQGDTSTPLVSLSNAPAGSEGISVTVVPDYTYYDPKAQQSFTGEASLVLIQIDEATLEGLALGTPSDCPVRLHYDLHVTPSGKPKRVAVYGSFDILPGVTI